MQKAKEKMLSYFGMEGSIFNYKKRQTQADDA